MVKKFFPLDKNYLLEAVQLSQERQLLTSLMTCVKEAYFTHYNPLRLPDKRSELVEQYELNESQPLRSFYLTMAAVYRLKFGQNQLEFLWDGVDHDQHYEREWADFFKSNIHQFCTNELFVRAILDLTVFFASHQPPQMAENRMHHFMLRYFEVKLHKHQGLVRVA